LTLINVPPPGSFTSFTITVNGEVDLTLPGLPGALVIAGSAVFNVNTSQSSLDLSVLGSVNLDPLGNLIGLAGKVHFDVANGTPELYGIFALQTGQLSQLQQLGINVAGIAVLRFNTTGQDVGQTLQIPGQASSTNFTLPHSSVSLVVNGEADFQRNGPAVVRDQGGAGRLFHPREGRPECRPPDAPGLRRGDPDHRPFDRADRPVRRPRISADLRRRVAAFVTITLVSSDVLTQAGITLKNDTFSFVLNTTGQEVKYTTPALTDPGKGTFPGAGGAVDIPAARPARPRLRPTSRSTGRASSTSRTASP